MRRPSRSELSTPNSRDDIEENSDMELDTDGHRYPEQHEYGGTERPLIHSYEAALKMDEVHAAVKMSAATARIKADRGGRDLPGTTSFSSCFSADDLMSGRVTDPEPGTPRQQDPRPGSFAYEFYNQ